MKNEYRYNMGIKNEGYNTLWTTLYTAWLTKVHSRGKLLVGHTVQAIFFVK